MSDAVLAEYEIRGLTKENILVENVIRRRYEKKVLGAVIPFDTLSWLFQHHVPQRAKNRDARQLDCGV